MTYSPRPRANLPTYGANRPPACVHCEALECNRHTRGSRAAWFVFYLGIAIGAILLAGALIGGAP